MQKEETHRGNLSCACQRCSISLEAVCYEERRETISIVEEEEEQDQNLGPQTLQQASQTDQTGDMPHPDALTFQSQFLCQLNNPYQLSNAATLLDSACAHNCHNHRQEGQVNLPLDVNPVFFIPLEVNSTCPQQVNGILGIHVLPDVELSEIELPDAIFIWSALRQVPVLI